MNVRFGSYYSDFQPPHTITAMDAYNHFNVKKADIGALTDTSSPVRIQTYADLLKRVLINGQLTYQAF